MEETRLSASIETAGGFPLDRKMYFNSIEEFEDYPNELKFEGMLTVIGGKVFVFFQGKLKLIADASLKASQDDPSIIYIPFPKERSAYAKLIFKYNIPYPPLAYPSDDMILRSGIYEYDNTHFQIMSFIDAPFLASLRLFQVEFSFLEGYNGKLFRSIARNLETGNENSHQTSLEIDENAPSQIGFFVSENTTYGFEFEMIEGKLIVA